MWANHSWSCLIFRAIHQTSYGQTSFLWVYFPCGFGLDLTYSYAPYLITIHQQRTLQIMTFHTFPKVFFHSFAYFTHFSVIHKQRLDGKSYGPEISHPKPTIYRTPYKRSNPFMTKSICNRIVLITDAYIYYHSIKRLWHNAIGYEVDYPVHLN